MEEQLFDSKYNGKKLQNWSRGAKSIYDEDLK